MTFNQCFQIKIFKRVNEALMCRHSNQTPLKKFPEVSCFFRYLISSRRFFDIFRFESLCSFCSPLELPVFIDVNQLIMWANELHCVPVV